ncbi:protein of unknown function [Paenibacillus sophorae]|uniref:DUF1835 domain-containing protein n=1 Tax=Paenibacillus sophorae TaxID=1333845 RepID=A0A1H8IYG1_9BACL|nr:DUF1835 domain-containing protein [Paenibacillus sophorae]QWU16113.1 DUF1835 domain-containing protein [Paenibacillus sophorae]SEN72947.1 protein of unknown function [Paenibacillus sophorae]
MLHITNGDSVADKLRQGAVQGEVVAWREIYSVGPVFRDMAERQNREMRAGYLERNLGIPREEYLKNEEQERILRDLQKYNEIVLWFEYDLFDQTMLCYLLHSLAVQALGDTKLSLLCIGDYPGVERFRGLGQLTVKQLQALSGTWRSISERELALGSKMWEAYTSPLPDQHIRFLEEDTSALPFVKKAFEAHLSRIPSVHNRLGVVEQATLETVSGSEYTPHALFGQVGEQLHILGMGDLEYWHYLRNMSEEPYPLLHIQGLEAFPDFSHAVPSFADCRITLTALGRKVLAGEEDYLSLKGKDEWYGGLHLEGQSDPWRWDTSCNRLIKR